MVESSVAPLVERFSGLERHMEAEVKTRKGNEDHALGSIKDTMATRWFLCVSACFGGLLPVLGVFGMSWAVFGMFRRILGRFN